MLTCRAFFSEVRLVGCAGLLATTSSVLGQDTNSPEGPDIVVEAPRAVPLGPERSPYTGASSLVVTLRISALYGDLDLSEPGDAARLIKRLESVSHDACQQLDRLYPLVPDPDCVDRAMIGATATAKLLIAGARKQD